MQTFFFALLFQMLGFLSIGMQVFSQSTKSATNAKLSDQSIIKDSSGQIYSNEIWKKLMMTGYYTLKAEKPTEEKSDFILVRLPDDVREKRLSNSPKPKETKAFTTGKAVSSFSTTDINGKRIKLKELKGKVVVINFWFINCPPCRAEIFELNKLVQDYKDSSTIAFLAIALDDRQELKDFLKREPFNYTIIDSGRDIATQYGISGYPTHLIIDKEGNAYFHTSGAGSTTVYWLRKSITELMTANK